MPEASEAPSAYANCWQIHGKTPLPPSKVTIQIPNIHIC
jgi:hypothetical protein